MPLNNIEKLEYHTKSILPTFFKGRFKAETLAECFIHLNNFQKGTVWVNGFNLGRYWNIGPQLSLYLPGALLKPENEIVVLELEKVIKQIVTITDEHII